MRYVVGFLLVLLSVSASYAQSVSQLALPLKEKDLSTLDSCNEITAAGLGSIVVDVSGTFSGTLTWTVGTGSRTVPLYSSSDRQTPVYTTTAAGGWDGPVNGWDTFQVCMTSYTSGTATVRVYGSASAWSGAGSAAVTADIPSAPIGSFSTSDAVPTIDVDKDTGLPVTYGTSPAFDIPFDPLGDGPVMQCRGKTAAADGASVDDSFIPVQCSQYGEVKTMLSVDGTKLTKTGTALDVNIASGTATVTGSVTTSGTVTNTPAAGVGVLIRSDSSDNDDETQISATATTLRSVRARNANATTDAFFRCTNATAANTTPGSTTIVYEMMIPFGGGFVDTNINMTFSTAMTCYIATGKTAASAVDAAADDVVVVVITS